MNFEATIRFGDVFYTFYFTEIRLSTGLKYFVRTKNPKKENIFFEIIQDPNGKWKLVQPVPDWILARESDLLSIIELH
jgi:hypothetical protein